MGFMKTTGREGKRRSLFESGSRYDKRIRLIRPDSSISGETHYTTSVCNYDRDKKIGAVDPLCADPTTKLFK